MTKKSYKMETNCTAEQKKRISERAAEYGMSVAEFLLFCALNTNINMTITKFFDSIERDLQFAEDYHIRNKTTEEEFTRTRHAIIARHEKSAGILHAVEK